MSTIWFSSDQHFNHGKILTFVGNDGERIRPRFSDVDEMNETMIAHHNLMVKPTDKWYCLGDVGFDIDRLGSILSRLNGKKRLILGNHDYTKKKDFMTYFEHFEKVMLERRMGNVVFSHRPIYLGEHESHIVANVHGHIHEKSIDDLRYLNVSVERTNYFPLSLDDIESVLRGRGIRVDTKL